MIRSLITGTVLFLYCALRCSADEALQVPTHGSWQGEAIGTWVATRMTFGAPRQPAEPGKIYKTLLLGEDQFGNTIVVRGEADENGRFIEENPSTVSSAWSEDNPIPTPDFIREEVLELGGRSYPVVVRVFSPKPDKRSGVMMGSEMWELKTHPGFVLMRNETQKDRFKGETFEYLIRERVTAAGETNVLGRIVPIFHIQHEETVEGRASSMAQMLRSPELPNQGLIHSRQFWYDENGDQTRNQTKELVVFGHAPEEAAGHQASVRARPFHRSFISLDSEAGRTNVVHLMRQGMPRDFAEEVVTTRISVEDMDSGRKRAGELAVLWDVYQAGRSEENRHALLSGLQQVGGNSIGYIEPSLEKILLAVASDDDTDLRIAALTSLSGFVPVLYAPMLEDALIESRLWTNAPAIEVLSSRRWGNPRLVLSQDEVDLSTLPLSLIPYAPETLAVPELIKRFYSGDRYERWEVLELLACYSTPEVREFFTRLSASLTPDDFRWDRTDQFNLVIPMITATANLNLENAPELFLKWMDWNQSVAGREGEDGRDLVMKTTIDWVLFSHGLRLRDERVASAIVNSLKPGVVTLYILVHEGQLDSLPDVDWHLTPQKMEALLSEPVTIWMAEEPLEGEQLYGLLRLLRFSPTDENLDYVMSKLAPEWTPDIDYAAVAELQAKHWYTRRNDIKPLRVHDMHPEIVADVLPSFGDRGAKILIQLAAYPGFRRHVVPALMKILDRREEARETLSGIQSGTDDEDFLVGLALWCLGDGTQQPQYEKYIRFDSLHSARSGDAREAMRYLPFATVYPLIQDIRSDNPDNRFPGWAATVLSYHKNRKSAALMLSMWDDSISCKHNPEFGELFNRMAGRNFGMDRSAIRKWIESLPEE